MKKLSHINNQGEANMVDVGEKPDQQRIARAKGIIYLQSETLDLINDNLMKKGDVLAIARIAGIQAAKQTSALIPLCHTIILNKVSVDFNIVEDGIEVFSEARCNGKTGVEMEALTAVSMACLTIYDMCKAVDKHMTIGNIQLVNKEKL